jgi:hypothetical protein
MDFVEVVVEATGKTQSVPADWLDSPVLSVGLRKVETQELPPPPPVETPVGNPEVQTVLGESDTEPVFPALRSDFVGPDAQPEPPTERNTHAEIDHFALAHSISLGDAVDGTKTAKLAVINQALNPGGTESSTDTPATGDEEN